jgi:hypothetical protein
MLSDPSLRRLIWFLLSSHACDINKKAGDLSLRKRLTLCGCGTDASYNRKRTYVGVVICLTRKPDAGSVGACASTRKTEALPIFSRAAICFLLTPSAKSCRISSTPESAGDGDTKGYGALDQATGGGLSDGDIVANFARNVRKHQVRSSNLFRLST